MAKDDHWFKFFYKLILISCQGWKDDEFGAYVRLLINQFDRGSLPDDPGELNKLITSYRKNWPMLSNKFKRGPDGRLRNEFMDQIRKDRDEKSKRFTEYGKTGGRPNKNQKDKNLKPEGYEKKTYISPSLSSSDSMEEGMGPGREEGEVGISPEGFFVDTKPKDLKLTEIQIGATVEYIRLKCKKVLDVRDVCEQWEAFKIQKFSLHRWYNSLEELISHFRDSIKFEKQNQDANEKSNSRPSKTSGIERAIDTALSNADVSGN